MEKYFEAKFDKTDVQDPIKIQEEARSYLFDSMHPFGATLRIVLNYEGGNISSEARDPELLDRVYARASRLTREIGATYFSLEGIAIGSKDPLVWEEVSGSVHKTRITAFLQRYIFSPKEIEW